jgi:hypothetical protein
MKKLLFGLALLGVSCGSALAWNIQVEADVYNASSCSVVVTGVKVSLRPSGGGASGMDLLALSPQVTIAPHASTHISASYAWPTDTVPGGDQSTVEFNNWDGTADSQALGSAGSWSGTTITVGGAANLTQPSVSFTIDYSNTSGSDEVCWVYFSNGDLVSDAYLVNPSYIDAGSISSAYTPGGFSAPACYLPLHYVYSNAVAITTPPPSTNDVPASVTNAPPPLLTNAVPDMTNTPSVTTNLPTVPNVNSNVVWNDTSATLGGVGQSVRDGNGAINNTLWTAANQDHADMGAVVNAIKTASGQDHSDNGALKAAIDQVRLQAHSDAVSAGAGQSLYGIQAHNDVQLVISKMASIGTNRAGSGNDTNGAQELTLQKLYASTTNLTGAALGSQSTLGGISNLLSHMGTNGLGSGTNALAVTMTNYSTETTETDVLGTLAGMSNLLAAFTATNSLETNHIGAESSAGYAAAIEGTNLLAGFGVQEFSGGDAVGSALSGWTISIPYGGGYTIDLNPFHQSWVVALAAFTRFFITWALVASLMMVNTSALLSTLQAQGSIRQASASGQSILGNNLNLVTAILMAVLITAVMLAVPIYALGWLSSHGVFGQGFITFLAGNPFKSSQANGVGAAIYITDQFFPLSFIAFAAVAGVGFKAGMNLNVWLTNTVSRHLVG